MAVSLSLAVLGALIATPFALAMHRAASPARVLRLWLWLLATTLGLWLLCTLVFHSGLITDQRSRILAALVLNVFWVCLVVATVLGSVVAVVQTARLRRLGRCKG